MRVLSFAAVLSVLAGPALAQDAPPLQPYVPPPSQAPLAPLAGDQTAVPADPPLGDVREKSSDSSNISSADTRSPIAPILPTPDVASDTPQAFLLAAKQAIQTGQTGEAQEALERAESRVLSRDVAPSEASNAIEGPMIAQIGAARQALSVGNSEAALRAIDAALQAG